MTCPNCSKENPADARFCNSCGSSLTEAAPVLESPTSDGERRQITCFFADVSGYTAMQEHLDPEEVQALMNRVLAAATEIVEKYGGRIERMLGDAVMAVFGDPVMHEDDAERAVRAVLELHAAVDAMSPEVEGRIGRPMGMHTGINTGIVITGPGSDLDTAVGDAINIASRLEDLSEMGEILIGPETAQAVAGVFETTHFGDHDLKGKSRPVPVTKVLGLSSERAEPSRRQAEFVGRHEELGILLSAVERMRDGESSLVTIEAEAGAGKTRLLAEFKTRLPDEVQWLEGRAYAFGQNIPYAPVIDLLRRAADIQEDDPQDVVDAKLHAAVVNLVDDVDDVYAPLARLFGLATPEGVALDRETYRERLLDAVTATTTALANRAPTVLTFQDLHWADPSTIQLINQLIDRLLVPLVVVANFRPGFELGAPGERKLELRELSPRLTGELLSSLLDGAAPPDGLADFIVDRTDGNPFFVEEIVNSLLETDALTRSNGGWQLSGSLSELDLPTSIRGVIGARIDRLDEHRRRVLREASVVGREFLYEIVRRVTTLDRDLDDSLAELESADLIREKAADPDLEYFFKHALTQDVAYDGLLRAERQDLHAKAAAAIEDQFHGRLSEVTETLAYHWSRSGNLAKTVEFSRAAGRKAMERFALEESQSHFESAYEVARDAPEGPDRDEAIVSVLLDWAFLAYYQARLFDLRKLMIEHQDSVDRIGDPEQRGMWLSWIGHAYMTADGEFATAGEYMDRALAIGRESGNVRVIGFTQAWRAYNLYFQVRLDDAEAAGREGRRLGKEVLGDPYVAAKATAGLALVLAMLKGDVLEASQLADELVEVGARTGHSRSSSMGHFVHTIINWLAVDEAKTSASQAASRELARDPIYEHAGAVGQLFSLIDAQRAGPAREYYDYQWTNYIEGRHMWMMRRLFQIGDGALHVLEGDPATGFDEVEAIRDAASDMGNPMAELFGGLVLARLYAEVALANTDIGQLARNARFALTRGRRAAKEGRTGLIEIDRRTTDEHVRGLRMQIALPLARLLISAGKGAEARPYLERAIEMFEPLGDTAGVREAKRLLSAVG